MGAKNKTCRVAVAVAVAAVLSACASTHGLAPQSSVNEPDTLQTAATLANTAVSSDAWPESQWWTQFQDPQLNQLIAEGLAGVALDVNRLLVPNKRRGHIQGFVTRVQGADRPISVLAGVEKRVIERPDLADYLCLNEERAPRDERDLFR